LDLGKRGDPELRVIVKQGSAGASQGGPGDRIFGPAGLAAPASRHLVAGFDRIPMLATTPRSLASSSLPTSFGNEHGDVLRFLVLQVRQLSAGCASTRFRSQPMVLHRADIRGSAAGVGSVEKVRGCALHRGLPSPASGCRRCATRWTMQSRSVRIVGKDKVARLQ
jgi:hypothetical protein